MRDGSEAERNRLSRRLCDTKTERISRFKKARLELIYNGNGNEKYCLLFILNHSIFFLINSIDNIF